MAKFIDGLVSIITPVYNATDSVEKSILSVLDQSYEDWELILVDDCSSDNSAEVIAPYTENSKIYYFKNEQNVGPANTRNNGIQRAKGQYIAFLDADDYWKKEKLSTQLPLLQNSVAPLICSSHIQFEKDKVVKTIKVGKKKISYKSLLRTNDITTSTVIVDRNVTGQFSMPDFYHEDFACWLNLTKSFGPAITCPEALTYYRVGEVSLSSNKVKSAKKVYNIYRNFLKFSIPRSIYHMLFYAYYGYKKHKL